MNPKLDEYITKAYDRLLDFSRYHCSMQGMGDESVDLLNEVLIDLLKKDEAFLLGLLLKQRERWTELDYYILNLIKTYCSSPTAPYRWKFGNRLANDENYTNQQEKLNPIDYGYSSDECLHTLRAQRLALIRFIFDRLPLDSVEKEIAVNRILGGETANEVMEHFGGNDTTYTDLNFIYDCTTVAKSTIFRIVDIVCQDQNFDLKLNWDSKKGENLNSVQKRAVDQLVAVWLNVHWYPAFNEKSVLKRLLDEV